MAAKKDILVVLEFDDKGSYKIKKTIGDVSTILAKAGTEAGKAGQGFTKLKTDATAAAGGMDKLKGSFKSGMLQMAAGLGLWTGMSSVLRALTTNLKDVVTKGREFDTSFSKVSIMLKGTAEESEKVKMSLLRMSPALGSSAENARTLGMSLREFAEIPIAEHFKMVEQAAILATSAYTTNEIAMEALTSVIKGFHLETSQASQVSDVMTKATQLENVSFEEITKTILKLSSTAYQAGVGLDELVATFLTLTHTGVDSQTAMMQLRMLLQGIMKPSAGATAEARKLGLEWGVAGVKAQGFSKWLSELGRVTQGNSAILDNLFQGGRTLVGVINLASTASKELTSNIGDLSTAFNGGNDAQRVFLERMKTVNFWLKMAGELFNKLKVAIWEGFTGSITKGAGSAEEMKKRIDALTQSVITTGLSIGKAIGDAIKFIVKFKDELVLLFKVWLAFTVASKAVSFGRLLMAGIETGLTTMPRLAGAMSGITAALGTAVAALAAFAAGWKIGEWLSDVTGLKKKILEIGDWGAGAENTKQLKAMTDLKAALRDTGESAIQLKIKYGSYSAALEAVNNGTEKLIKAKVEEKKALSESSQAAATAAEAETNRLAGLREMLKGYGYTLKTEVQDRYDTLKQGLADFGDQMTKIDYDRMKKELRELGAVLGKNSQALLNLGILTKTEVSVEVIKITKDFWDLKKEMEAGNITWANYQAGIDAINEALKKLDPTLTATLNNMTKVAETPLPSPKKWNLEAPGLMTEEQMMGPAVQYPTPPPRYFSGFMDEKAALLGIQRATQYKYKLVEVEEAYRSLKATADITHQDEVTAVTMIADLYHQLGLTVPKEYQKIIDKAAEAAKGMSSDMIKGFSALGTALQVFGDTAGEKLKPLVTAAASVAGQIASSLTRQFNEMGGKGKMDFKNLKKAFKELSGELAGALGAALGGLIGGGGANTYGGIGAALGGALGSILPGVGNVIGSLVGGLFGGLFKKKKTAEQKAAEELKKQVDSVTKSYKSLGDITEATAKKIIDLTKQYNKQTATIMTLTDVMNDAGISMKNLQGYVTKMTQALRDMASGTVDVQKGMDAIGSAFNALITWAQKFDKEGSKALVSFMQYLRKIGVSIAEVDDYVFGALEKGAGGLKSMVESVGGSGYKQLITYRDEIKTLGEEVDKLSMSKISERAAQREYLQKKAQLEELRKKYDDLKTSLASGLAPELERVGRLTVAMFSSFIQQGKSMSETFALMGDSLVALRDKYTELGLTGGAAIEDLFKLVDIQKANEGLFEGLEGTRQLLKALGDTGFLTAESLADLSTQATGYYDKLISAGLDPKQAMAMVSPTLSDLAYYAEQYGLKLDAGTEMLIAQAKLAGTWKDRGKDINVILEEGFSDLIGRADRLIKLGEESHEDRRGRETYAQHGFEGTVTGPRTFYVEPGVTEAVRIGRPGKVESDGSQVTVIEKNVTFEPVIIPFKHLQSLVIEWVQKASADERILVRPRAVRGRG